MGRCCLQTATASTLWFVFVALTYAPAKIYLGAGARHAFVSEWGLIYISIFMPLGITALDTLCKPTKDLAPMRPTSGIFTSRSLVMLAIPSIIYLICFFGTSVIMHNQSWYIECDVSYENGQAEGIQGIAFDASYFANQGERCTITEAGAEALKLDDDLVSRGIKALSDADGKNEIGIIDVDSLAAAWSDPTLNCASNGCKMVFTGPGVQFFWYKWSDNYDTALWFILLLFYYPVVGYIYSFGYRFRRSVVFNIPLTLFVCFSAFLAFYLLWGGPSWLHCVFRINCDEKHSYGSNPAFFSWLSAGSIGGCFYAPQLCKMAGESLSYQTPQKDNQCKPSSEPNWHYDDINPFADENYGQANPECVGLNNCIPNYFRTQITIWMCTAAVLTAVFHFFFMRRHWGVKEHFSMV